MALHSQPAIPNPQVFVIDREALIKPVIVGARFSASISVVWKEANWSKTTSTTLWYYHNVEFIESRPFTRKLH